MNNPHSDEIEYTFDLEEEASTLIKQRLIFISQAEHTLQCLKLELEAHIKQNHPETSDAKQIGISPDAKQISYK